MKVRDVIVNTMATMVARDTTPVAIKEIAWDKIDIFEYVLKLDEKNAVVTLQKMIKDTADLEATSESIQPFVKFLASRWQLTKSTDLSYVANITNPINMICYFLANEISELAGRSKYALLMPTVDCETSLSTTEWDSLSINHFVLSDDNTKYIDILECLETAEIDCKFKHTSLIPGAHEPGLDKDMKTLSETEEMRIVNHSLEAKNYVAAVKSIIDIKTKGMTLGAYLNRLIFQMRFGGVHNSEDEHLSHLVPVGEASVNGIQEFHELTKQLSETELTRLYSCDASYTSLGNNFEDIWFRILNRAVIEGQVHLSEMELDLILDHLIKMRIGSDEGPPTDQPCIEMLANAVESILKRNLDLYNIIPTFLQSADNKNKILSAYNQVKAEAITSLTNKMARYDAKTKELYKSRGVLLFIERMKFRLALEAQARGEMHLVPEKVLCVYLKKINKEKFNLTINNYEKFKTYLNLFAQAKNKYFLWNKLSEDNFVKIFSTTHALSDTLKSLQGDEKTSLVNLLPEDRLAEIFTLADKLAEVLQVLDEDNQITLLGKISTAHWQMLLKNERDLSHLFKATKNILVILTHAEAAIYQNMLVSSNSYMCFYKLLNQSQIAQANGFLSPDKIRLTFSTLNALIQVSTLPLTTQVLIYDTVLTDDFCDQQIQNFDELSKLIQNCHIKLRDIILEKIPKNLLIKLSIDLIQFLSLLNVLTYAQFVRLMHHTLDVDKLFSWLSQQRFHMLSYYFKHENDKGRGRSAEAIYTVIGPRCLSLIDTFFNLSEFLKSLPAALLEEVYASYAFSVLCHDLFLKDSFLDYSLRSYFSMAQQLKILSVLPVNLLITYFSKKETFFTLMHQLDFQTKRDLLEQLPEKLIISFCTSAESISYIFKLFQEVGTQSIFTLIDLSNLPSFKLDLAGLSNVLSNLSPKNQIGLIQSLPAAKLIEVMSPADESHFLPAALYQHTQHADVKKALLFAFLKAFYTYCDSNILAPNTIKDKTLAYYLMEVIEGKRTVEILQEQSRFIGDSKLKAICEEVRAWMSPVKEAIAPTSFGFFEPKPVVATVTHTPSLHPGL